HELARLRALQVALGLERGHAAGAGGGHRLAVDVILDVSGGEDTGHRRLRRPRDDLDVVVGQEVELAAKDLGVRTMPDRDKEAVVGMLVEVAGFEVLVAVSGDLTPCDVEDVVDGVVLAELDLSVLAHELLSET